MKIKSQIVLFIVLAFSIAWILFLLIPLLGLTYGEPRSIILLTGAMFAPAIASLLTRVITKEGFKNMLLKPNFKGNVQKYVGIYFGPTLLILFSGLFYFLLFPQNYNPDLSQYPPGIVALGITQIALVGPVINIIPTLGEELGWRGYLLPKLRKLFSDRTSLVISGVIWGLWHAPVIIMGHNYGNQYPLYPYLGIIAMVVFCLFLGIIEGYFTIKMNSVIPAAMIHSTVNAGAALPLLLVKQGVNQVIGPTIAGLVGGIPFFVVAIILFVRWRSPKTLQDDQSVEREKLSPFN
ncbi:MAG: type II CAAX endopeptidase family protein [Sphaerochaetaceae bacterium]